MVPIFLTETVNSLGVTTTMLEGVLAEVIDLLPIVLPAAIGYLALRKGIAFVLGTIKRA